MSTIRESIESLIDQFPICEYCFGDTAQIPFSDKVLYICESDCKRYGKSWSCPPYSGTIQDNITRCRAYEHFFLYSTVCEVSDAWNADVCLEARKEHETLAREFRAQLSDLISEKEEHKIYMLSTGCSICETCACPADPCRHPVDRLMSMESHGIVIMQLAEEMGLCFNYGGETAVYFTMILFHDV